LYVVLYTVCKVERLVLTVLNEYYYIIITSRWQVFLLPWTLVHRKQVTRVLWIVFSLHLCKEYLTAVKLKTLFLLQIKYWIFWYYGLLCS